MKATPFLDVYYKFANTDFKPNGWPMLPTAGLCQLFCMIVQTKKGKRHVPRDGFEAFQMFIDTQPLNERGEKIGLWASDNGVGGHHEFGSLRQSIVLFCAAISGEFDQPDSAGKP